jgi:hypothetical protein
MSNSFFMIWLTSPVTTSPTRFGVFAEHLVFFQFHDPRHQRLAGGHDRPATEVIDDQLLVAFVAGVEAFIYLMGFRFD